jgi:four helix bundle protein
VDSGLALCELNGMTVQNFRELIAWQRAVDLVLEVYTATKSFPREEIYGLTSQIRRAVVSISSNIAEGQSRRTSRDFLHFLGIARGSLAEVETQLHIATRLLCVSSEDGKRLNDRILELHRILSGLIASLERRSR